MEALFTVIPPLFLLGTTLLSRSSISPREGQSIEQIVKRVTSSKKPLLMGLKLDSQIEMEREPSTDDPKRPLKGVATDFVVNEFFKTQESLFNFLKFVYETFDTALTLYRKERQIPRKSAFFVYKGGNILRVLSREFLLEMPANSTRKLHEFYDPFFKRSDADFSIYLNPKVKNYDNVYRELNDLSYLLQDYIRGEFQSNRNVYFDFFKFNKVYVDEQFEKYQEEMNSTGKGNAFSNLSLNDNVKEDFALEFTEATKFEDDIRNVNVYSLPLPDPSYMQVTYNTSLDFPSGAKLDRRTKFSLVRTKIQFNLQAPTEVISFGGELIDVSMGHKLDSNMTHFFDKVDKYVREYTLTYKDKNLKFLSYDISYLIDDLETILFKFNPYPWDDVKYAKRLNRLIYLYFVNMFMTLDSSSARTTLLTDFKTYVADPLNSSKISIKGIKNELKKFTQKYSKNKNLYILNFIKLLNALLDNVSKANVANLKEMSKVILENINFLISTVSNVKEYCKIDGKITNKHVYTGSVSSMLGGAKK